MCRRVLDEGWSPTEAAEAAGVSERTCFKWLARLRIEGEAGLIDRTSAPRRTPSKTAPPREKTIVGLRELRMTSAEIAECLEMPLSTVRAVLSRHGLGRLRPPQDPEPPNRYERRHAGELIHIDMKKLARINRPGRHLRFDPGGTVRHGKEKGYEYLHVAVDDATRVAYAEVLPNQTDRAAIGFLLRATAFFNEHGVVVKEVMTDNGGCYCSKIHALACHKLGIKHLRTRPYRPRTNGKAERFIRTIAEGWAHRVVYSSSEHRVTTLPAWLHRYNHRRRHGSLGETPIKRLGRLTMNNVAVLYN